MSTFDAVRQIDRAPEIRDAGGSEDGIGVMHGHFSTFNDWYRVDSSWEGTFLERIAPGAYADTIAEDLSGMRVLFDHGFDPQLGNKVLGPIRSLTEDKTGAHFEVPLFDTAYNRDLLPGLRAGQYGSSMRFEVTAEDWVKKPTRSDYNPEGIPERTITRSRVKEFGPVTFPANAQATAGVRSTTDAYYERLKVADRPAYVGAMRSRLIAVTEARAMSPQDLAMCNQCLVWLTQIDNIVDQALQDLSTYLGVPNPDADHTDADENPATAAAVAGSQMTSHRPSGAMRARGDDDTLKLLGII
jgi:HK97 family phage prohead protease